MDHTYTYHPMTPFQQATWVPPNAQYIKGVQDRARVSAAKADISDMITELTNLSDDARSYLWESPIRQAGANIETSYGEVTDPAW